MKSILSLQFTTEANSLSELDLPIDLLVAIDVAEIQARIATHTAQILNFFSPIL